MKTALKNSVSANFTFKASVAMVGVLLVTGCELTEEDRNRLKDAFYLNPPTQNPPDPVNPNCFNERFVQPEAQGTNKLDILFVTDSSGSFNQERGAVADGIDAFVAELPAQVDYRIGVMLAHGDLSQYSGKLFKHANEPVVLDSQQQTLQQIRTQLRTKMTNVRGDWTTDGGEAGIFSLNKGIQGADLAANRQHGLFREDAALAVIFVADENDICAIYPNNVTRVADPDQLEGPAFDYYCNRNGQILTALVLLNQLRALQGDMPLLVGGVIYNDPLTVPSGGENEIGYGYTDVIELGNGISIDLANGSYHNGLAEIGGLATVKLFLVTEFTLARPNINIASIEVEVDGQPVPYNYMSQTNEVHLDQNHAGVPRSVVDINYCLQPNTGGGGGPIGT